MTSEMTTNLTVNCTENLSNEQMLVYVKQLDLSVGKKTLLTEATLKIERGHKYGLIGKNGTGKSSLLRVLATSQIQGYYTPVLVEQELLTTTRSVLNELLQSSKAYTSYLEREEELSKLLDREEDLSDDQHDRFQEELEGLYGLARNEGYYSYPAKAKKILAGLGFSEEMQDRSVTSYSGGWRMRISLAKALFLEPPLLLLDEPTNHLDFYATIWLTSYVAKLKSTIILVSHNITFLDETVDRIIELDGNVLREYTGNYTQYKKAKEIEFSQAVNKFNKQKRHVKSRKERKKLQPREYQVKLKLDTDQNEYNKVLKVEMQEVGFIYPNGHQIFIGLNFSLQEGDKVVVVGENGSGKSTFLKLLLGRLAPTKGHITSDKRISFGYFSQNYEEALDYTLTPVEYIQRENPELGYEETRKALSLANLDPKVHHNKIEYCSGGEKARIILANISAKQPFFIVFDEPTNNLDIYTIETLAEIINNLSCGLVLVTHDMYLINSLDDYDLYVCEDNDLSLYDGGIIDYQEELVETAV